LIKLVAAESKTEKAVCNYAEEKGYLVRKLKWADRRGAPDRFFAHRLASNPFMIEFKAPGESLRPDQAREIPKLWDVGLTVYIIDSEREGRAVIDAHLIDIA